MHINVYKYSVYNNNGAGDVLKMIEKVNEI